MASLDTSNMLNVCDTIHGFSDLERARIVEDSEGIQRYDVETCEIDERKVKGIADPDFWTGGREVGNEEKSDVAMDYKIKGWIRGSSSLTGPLS